MKQTEHNNYFTSGELANLYRIPKQTLLYYDKIGLLKPEFISSNGYRHYNIHQYLTLEIIINLRNLDIPIVEIKEYLANRSLENFIKLIDKKSSQCLKEISSLQKTYQSLSLVKQNTLNINNIILDQILLTSEPAKNLCLTHIENNQLGKNIIKMTARHVYKIFSKNEFREKNVGWVINKNDFFSNIYNKSIAFYSIYDTEEYLNNHSIYIRPAGLYISMVFKGTYYEKAPQLMPKLNNFMKINNLIPVSDIFVMPLKNHWLTTDVSQYINQLTIHVQNKTTV
ncbi:MerR family transcriptional regulator [Pectinatus brassicae]|uniref:DNA-binding transcriptional MerR regulator n=1 Tax=Pectinatus brassicae TaxID=862415 RepID=A0A840URL4_9FIRM|nr:MerR family transcriptional regulator [Pectinatus brassicae]MBB5335185.1 DNA-binding transcriptional MerR regulator [Pectinatus brassicae]